MANIQERKSGNGKASYRVQVRLKGHPTQTATFDRKTDAREWAQETEADIKSGRYFKTAEAKRHTLSDAIDRYLRDVMPGKKASSIYTQTIQLNWWKDRLGDLVLSDVTPPVIAEARDTLGAGETYRHTRRSQSTVLRYMAALSHCFTVAVKEWQWLDDNPMRRVSKPKEPRGRVRFLSDDERNRLLAACLESRNPCLYDFVVLLLSTGMRKTEALTLTWDRVDFHRALITLTETKNDERRAVPLVGHARERLEARARIRRIDSAYVFPAPYRHGEKPKPVDIQSAWDWAVKRAELVDFRMHDCRHSAASYMIMNGASIGEVAEILGHRTLQMVRRYSHISQPHAAKVIERMNAAIFPAQSKEESAS